MKVSNAEVFSEAKFKVGDRVRTITNKQLQYIVLNRIFLDTADTNTSNYAYRIRSYSLIGKVLEILVAEHEIIEIVEPHYEILSNKTQQK